MVMLNVLDNLPEDPTELRQVSELLAAEVKALTLKVEQLQHQLHGANRHRFGSTSESMDQLQLFAENEEIAEAAKEVGETAPSETVEPKAKPKRKPLPDHLERIEQVLSIGEDCPECGGDLSKLGEDVTEELEYIPGRFVVNKIIRPLMACRRCEAISQAPMPSRPIERGRPGPGLLAHVLVCKYADHLPLCRQSQIYAREGADLDRLTMGDCVGKSTALLEPLAEAIAKRVKAGSSLFADDTPLKMLAAGNKKTKTARIWAYVRDERPWSGQSPPCVWYQFTVDRKGEHTVKHLSGYQGWVHADGYAGFNGVFGEGKASEVACMAHIRPKFVDEFTA
jgi:transposase